MIDKNGDEVFHRMTQIIPANEQSRAFFASCSNPGEIYAYGIHLWALCDVYTKSSFNVETIERTGEVVGLIGPVNLVIAQSIPTFIGFEDIAISMNTTDWYRDRAITIASRLKELQPEIYHRMCELEKKDFPWSVSRVKDYCSDLLQAIRYPDEDHRPNSGVEGPNSQNC